MARAGRLWQRARRGLAGALSIRSQGGPMVKRRHREPPVGGLWPVVFMTLAMLVLFGLLVF